LAFSSFIIVDPLNLTKNFNFILQNAIIATDVSATMVLNKALTFRHEKNAENNKAVREIGNVTQESIITFEYYPKNKEDFKNVSDVCFQVQISFTKLDGSKCIRIISKRQKITYDRQEAEKHVNVNVVGLHSQVQAAQKAAEGKYSAARLIQKRNMRMVRRTLANEEATEGQQKHYELWNAEAVRFNDVIKQNKIKEKKKGINYDSAEEEGSDSDREQTVQEEEQKQKKKQERKERRVEDDDISNQVYQAQNPFFSAFTFDTNALYKPAEKKRLSMDK